MKNRFGIFNIRSGVIVVRSDDYILQSVFSTWPEVKADYDKMIRIAGSNLAGKVTFTEITRVLTVCVVFYSYETYSDACEMIDDYVSSLKWNTIYVPSIGELQFNNEVFEYDY